MGIKSGKCQKARNCVLLNAFFCVFKGLKLCDSLLELRRKQFISENIFRPS